MGGRTARKFAALAFGTAAIFAGFGAAAQTWPQRAITIIVPFAAGGGTDPVARRMFEAVRKKLGQNIIIDFRPGARATIGTRVAAVDQIRGDIAFLKELIDAGFNVNQ